MICLSLQNIMQSTKYHKDTSHKPGRLYSTLSMTLVLFLAGAFVVFVLNTDDLIKNFKENLDLIIEIKTDVPRDDARLLLKKIEVNDCIKIGSSSFVTREEGFNFLKKQLGQDVNVPVIENPLFDVIKFNLNTACIEKNKVNALITSIKQNSQVNEVYFPIDLVSGISVNIKKGAQLLLILSIIFGIIAVIIIHNTVKLALYANRFTIKTMEMVGASSATIKRPFLASALGIGLWSGLYASILLICLLMFLAQKFPDFIAFNNTLRLIWIVGGMIVSGIFISFFITWFVINRYIGRKIETLY